MYPTMLPTPPPSPIPHCHSAEDRLGLILADRLELTRVLGVGAYGVVYTAVDIQTNQVYAVKALNKHGLDPRQIKFQQREIKLHHLASQHPNVVSLVRILDSADCTFVVMEYCPEGDLFSNITDKGNFVGNDYLAKSVFLQLLDAVQFCHSMGIYHRAV
jgi:serine/threonine protein kinase